MPDQWPFDYVGNLSDHQVLRQLIADHSLTGWQKLATYRRQVAQHHTTITNLQHCSVTYLQFFSNWLMMADFWQPLNPVRDKLPTCYPPFFHCQMTSENFFLTKLVNKRFCFYIKFLQVTDLLGDHLQPH